MWTTDPNFMFLGANRSVLMKLTDEKRPNDPVPPRNIYIYIYLSKGIFLRTDQGDQNLSSFILNLPCFILSHEKN